MALLAELGWVFGDRCGYKHGGPSGPKEQAPKGEG